MKIAYVGFDLLISALETLVEDGHEIIKIFSCRTDNVCEFNTQITTFAEKYGIPITYDRITEEDLQCLVSDGCELLVSAGYYYRIPVTDEIRMMNIHPAALPVGRGAWPMPVTILRGLRESGVTIHKIAHGFDEGDILLRRTFEVSEREDLLSFMDKVNDIIPGMLRELLSDPDHFFDNAEKQGEGEYWAAPDEHDYVITSDTPFDEADLILRAFMGFECIYRDGDTDYVLQYGRAVQGACDTARFHVTGGYIEAENIRIL